MKFFWTENEYGEELNILHLNVLKRIRFKPAAKLATKTEQQTLSIEIKWRGSIFNYFRSSSKTI